MNWNKEDIYTGDFWTISVLKEGQTEGRQEEPNWEQGQELCEAVSSNIQQRHHRHNHHNVVIIILAAPWSLSWWSLSSDLSPTWWPLHGASPISRARWEPSMSSFRCPPWPWWQWLWWQWWCGWGWWAWGGWWGINSSGDWGFESWGGWD